MFASGECRRPLSAHGVRGVDGATRVPCASLAGRAVTNASPTNRNRFGRSERSATLERSSWSDRVALDAQGLRHHDAACVSSAPSGERRVRTGTRACHCDASARRPGTRRALVLPHVDVHPSTYARSVLARSLRFAGGRTKRHRCISACGARHGRGLGSGWALRGPRHEGRGPRRSPDDGRSGR
jgi:hypothetical protein